jgi:hypothetical protein
MRILFNLFVSSTARAAGVQQSIRVCYSLAQSGAQVFLHICTWAFSSKSELLEFFGFEDIENFHVCFYPNPFKPAAYVHPFNQASGGKLSFLWGAFFHCLRVCQLLFTSEKKQYDILLLRGARFPLLYILAKPFLNLTIIFEAHEIVYLNQVSEEEVYQTKKLIDLERVVYRRADGVIAISNTLRELLETRWGKVDKIKVLPAGATPFKSDPLSPSAYRTTDQGLFCRQLLLF